MKALITGATGFVGKALVARLSSDGVALRIWARNTERAKSSYPQAEIVAADRDPAALDRAIDGVDVIYNLAGEPVIGPRWTEERRRALEDSRVGVTRDLVAAIARAQKRPSALVSTSAVGYYGDRGDEPLDEASAPAGDFLAKLCAAWEEAALGAEKLGVRVVIVRIGIVLGEGGGALAQMITPFKLGVGGKLGSGKQWMPWIHLDDLIALFATAGRDDRYRGPFNGTGPSPVINFDFTKTLGKVLHRPTIAPVPKLALSVMFGEAANVLLGSQNARPKKALGLGFDFRFSELEPALRAVFPR
jgi:uncharacterized protein